MKQVPSQGPTNIRSHGIKFGNLEFVNPCCRDDNLCTTVQHYQLGNMLCTIIGERQFYPQ
jgi:hypothetical protein